MKKRFRRTRQKQWLTLLGKLGELATEYAREASTRELGFAAMHSALTTLEVLARAYAAGPGRGWTTIMSFAAPSPETSGSARLSVSILEGAAGLS